LSGFSVSSYAFAIELIDFTTAGISFKHWTSDCMVPKQRAYSMAATSPAISYFTQNPASCSPVRELSVDELCDELLLHMLDCDLCLNRGEHTCSVHQSYQNQIALGGRPQRGTVFAF
jgi:hypothetical protein